MKRRAKGQSGFTLVELMVTMVAAVIVLSSVYFVSAASTRHFHEQHRIAQTQMSLRMAMEQLRRDIAKAGYLGTPNSAVDQNCLAPPARVAAIDGFVDNDATATGWLPNAGQNGVTADRIVLTGNYATSDGYLAIGLNSTGSTVFLQRTWQGFRRSFGVPATFSADAFEDVFATGRILHLRTLQGNHFFARITGTDAASASVTFTPAIGVGRLCVVGLADGAMVAPLSRIEYTVNDLTVSAPNEAGNLDPVGGPAADEEAELLGRVNAMLVRRELQYNNGAAVVAGMTRPILEYVADFNLEFVTDDQLTVGAAPNLDRKTGAEAAPIIANTPHRLRSVIVRLSARTAEQDPRFPFVARAAGDPLSRYRVNPELPGAARVRTLQEEIVLHNVASRVIRP